MRPKSIIWFEALYLASTVVGAINMAVAWEEMVAVFSPAGTLTVFAASILFAVVLVLLVSRKASRIAKWVLVGLFAFGLLALLLPAIGGVAEPLGMAWNEWVVWTMQAVATGLLFAPSARDWMRRPKDPAANRDTLARTFE